MDADALAMTIAAQSGLLTFQQAADLGLSRSAVRARLRSRWTLVLPRVMLTSGAEMTTGLRTIAAQLYAGPGAMITSLAAAAWHGVTAAQQPLVQVSVPASRRPASTSFVVVRRTHRPDPRPWHRGPLVLVSRPRAVVEAARDAASTNHAVAIVCEAAQRRLVRLESLRNELEAGPTAGSARVREALRVAEAGAWSVAEADLHRLVHGVRALSPMWLNPTLETTDGVRLPIPDGWFDEVGLAVQVHSWRWHSSMADWDGTVMSDGIFAEYGVPVVGVTPRALRTTPDQVLRRLCRAHEQAARRPRPQVSATPHSAAGHGMIRTG